MALRDQLLGTGSSVYNLLGSPLGSTAGGLLQGVTGLSSLAGGNIGGISNLLQGANTLGAFGDLFSSAAPGLSGAFGSTLESAADIGGGLTGGIFGDLGGMLGGLGPIGLLGLPIMLGMQHAGPSDVPGEMKEAKIARQRIQGDITGGRPPNIYDMTTGGLNFQVPTDQYTNTGGKANIGTAERPNWVDPGDWGNRAAWTNIYDKEQGLAKDILRGNPVNQISGGYQLPGGNFVDLLSTIAGGAAGGHGTYPIRSIGAQTGLLAPQQQMDYILNNARHNPLYFGNPEDNFSGQDYNFALEREHRNEMRQEND